MLKYSVLKALYDKEMILVNTHKFWTLQSGIKSPIYIQLRKLLSYPQLLKDISLIFKLKLNTLMEQKKLKKEHIHILGIAMTGIPLAISLSLETNMPALMTRKLDASLNITESELQIQSYGQHTLIEGNLKANSSIIIMDDIITSFKSKAIALNMIYHSMKNHNIKSSNYQIPYLFVVIDRQQINLEKIKQQYNMDIFSIFKMKEDILPFLKTKLTESEFIILKNYFENTLLN